jgi:phage-related protein
MGGKTQAVYYRDTEGREPVNAFTEKLMRTNRRAAAKIDRDIEQYLNGKDSRDAPPAYPASSQVDGEMRELRVRFANTRYRVLYQRSEKLVVLLHAFEKKTEAIPAADRDLAMRRFKDFRVRMGAEPRVPPRAAGRDAPLKARMR